MTKNKKPQLVMLKKSLKELPVIDLPDKYQVQSLNEVKPKHWNHIIQESFKDDTLYFSEAIAPEEYYKPERVLFIVKGNKPVATATAWYKEKWGEDTGYLHMVGVLPEFTGKALGYQVSLAVLYKMKKEGFNQAVLETDDFRVPAIVTYLKLGFKPEIVHENQYKRWENIKDKLNRDDLVIEISQ